MSDDTLVLKLAASNQLGPPVKPVDTTTVKPGSTPEPKYKPGQELWIQYSVGGEEFHADKVEIVGFNPGQRTYTVLVVDGGLKFERLEVLEDKLETKRPSFDG